MATEIKDTYTKIHLQQISNFFGEHFNDVYKTFYNNANKNDEKIAIELKNKISTLTQELLKEDKDLYQSKELTDLITEFNQSSLLEKRTLNISSNNDNAYINAINNLTKMTERLKSHVFKYDDPTTNANLMVKTSSKTEQKSFTGLTAISILAKCKLENRSPTKEEHTLLKNHYGEKKIPDLTKMSLEQIYNEYKTYYDLVSTNHLVTETAKTNYLKKSSIHSKDFRKIAGFTSLAALATGATTLLGGFPTANASWESFGLFMTNNFAPLALTGLGLFGGYKLAEAGIKNWVIRVFRNKNIRELSDKNKLFELVKKYTPTKNKLKINNNLIKQFENESGLSLGKGPLAKVKFNALIEAVKSADTIYYDNKLNSYRKKGISLEPEKNLLVDQDLANTLENKNLLSKYLNKDNPLVQIFGLKGTFVPARSKNITAIVNENTINKEPTTIENITDSNQDKIAEKVKNIVKEKGTSSKSFNIVVDDHTYHIYMAKTKIANEKKVIAKLAKSIFGKRAEALEKDINNYIKNSVNTLDDGERDSKEFKNITVIVKNSGKK